MHLFQGESRPFLFYCILSATPPTVHLWSEDVRISRLLLDWDIEPWVIETVRYFIDWCSRQLFCMLEREMVFGVTFVSFIYVCECHNGRTGPPTQLLCQFQPMVLLFAVLYCTVCPSIPYYCRGRYIYPHPHTNTGSATNGGLWSSLFSIERIGS